MGKIFEALGVEKPDAKLLKEAVRKYAPSRGKKIGFTICKENHLCRCSHPHGDANIGEIIVEFPSILDGIENLEIEIEAGRISTDRAIAAIKRAFALKIGFE